MKAKGQEQNATSQHKYTIKHPSAHAPAQQELCKHAACPPHVYGHAIVVRGPKQ